MKIYLAGPTVFRADAKSVGEAMKIMCMGVDSEGLFPMDNEATDHIQIFRGNLKMLDDADAVIADISPFRGVGMDAGTAWEIGYARAKGKPIFLYSNQSKDSYKSRVDSYLSPYRISGYLPNSIDYPSIEDFGLTDNLMIINSSSTDKVYDNFVDALKAFGRWYGHKI